MKRLTVAGTVLLALVAGASRAADKVKVTIPTTGVAYSIFPIAQEEGYYKAETLDVEIVTAGGGVSTPAVLAGDVQFTGSPGAAISAALKGAPIKLIFVTQDRAPYQLWASDPKIKTLQDLKGRQVGVTSRGDSTEIAVREVLQQAGVDPQSVAFTGMPNAVARSTALLSGTLPASIATFDDVAVLRHSPKVHMVADMSKMVTMVTGGAAASTRLLSRNPDLAKRFLVALDKSLRFMKAHREATIAATLRMDPKANRADTADVYDETVPTMTDGTVPVAVQQEDIDRDSVALGIPPEKRPKPAQVFDFSLIRAINRQLDAEGWKP